MVPITNATMESPAAQKHLDSSRGDLVVGEVATMDGTATHESHEANSKDESTGDPVQSTQGVLSRSPILGLNARDNALNTPELLEAIILLLPIREIFANAQRVSRTWYAVAQSPSIRTIMWLRPPTEEVASPVDFLATNSSSYPPSLELPSYIPLYSGSIAHNYTQISVTYNYRGNTFEAASVGAKYHRRSLAIPRTSSNTTRPTWYDMKLTEPGIRIAHLQIQRPTFGSHKKCSGVWVSVQDKDGLTFGTVLTTAQKACDGLDGDFSSRDASDVVIWFLTKY